MMNRGASDAADDAASASLCLSQPGGASLTQLSEGRAATPLQKDCLPRAFVGPIAEGPDVPRRRVEVSRVRDSIALRDRDSTA